MAVSLFEVVVVAVVVVVLVNRRGHESRVLTTAKLLKATDPSALRQVCGGLGEKHVVSGNGNGGGGGGGGDDGIGQQERTWKQRSDHSQIAECYRSL